jgi:5-methylcytosine-specific restriction protein B
MADSIRYGLILRAAMTVLRDSVGPLSVTEVTDAVRPMVQPTAYELNRVKSGGVRWEVALHFLTGQAATVGWMTKLAGWSLTEAGLEALEEFADGEALRGELTRLYREIAQRRKQARESLGTVEQFLARALELVVPGSWTAYDDLAALAGTTATEVTDFLAGAQVRLPNSYRVLRANGGLPDEGMLHWAYRGTDLRARLTAEGIQFDAGGLASQEQRLTDDALRELLDADASPAATIEAAQRAWMVRGSNVDGYNLVPEWLSGGFVSLSADQLSGLDPSVSHEQLKAAVDQAYEHKSYAYRGQRLAELDLFLRRMRPGDLVLTPLHGQVYLAEVSGPAAFVSGASPHANLRRSVRWLNMASPLDGGQLTAPVPALLQSQAAVVDLTAAYDQLSGLVPAVAPAETPIQAPAEPPRRSLEFHALTAQVADRLLMEQGELQKITDLLWERRQIILYGPSGTGKTYLATRLARHLTDDGAVKLVQFHPSYTYEDFFEGYRPKATGDGTLSFELRAGPFRDFAEAAQGNPTTPYILVIDEINRANLAKVFGELYFLLEYRDESISLQYSPDREFTLPPNLFLIGTMNTADRSIARIDTAMRRRFQFVELDPRIPPVHGLLSRWLDRRGLPQEAALLLEELNRRIEDSDAAIGPSYLMDERIYRRADGLERVWQYAILPLLEDLFFGQRDLAETYGLASLRKSIGAGSPE